MVKECKRHKWRVGAKTDCVVIKHKYLDIVPTKQVIWCENCTRVIKANIYSDYELKELKLSQSKQETSKK